MGSYFEESSEPLISNFSMVKMVKINGCTGRRHEVYGKYNVPQEE